MTDLNYKKDCSDMSHFLGYSFLEIIGKLWLFTHKSEKKILNRERERKTNREVGD